MTFRVHWLERGSSNEGARVDKRPPARRKDDRATSLRSVAQDDAQERVVVQAAVVVDEHGLSKLVHEEVPAAGIY